MATKREQIEERIKQLKAQLNAQNAKEAKKIRAERTRRLIQIGALLEADKTQVALYEKYVAQIEVNNKSSEVKKARDAAKPMAKTGTHSKPDNTKIKEITL